MVLHLGETLGFHAEPRNQLLVVIGILFRREVQYLLVMRREVAFIGDRPDLSPSLVAPVSTPIRSLPQTLRDHQGG